MVLGLLSRLKRRNQRLDAEVAAGNRDPRTNSEMKLVLTGLLEAEMDRAYAKGIASAKSRHNLLERESHKKLGTTLSKRFIDTLSKDDLKIFIEAAANPEYSLIKTLRWNNMDPDDRRGIALFFPVLHASGLNARLSYSNALYSLREISGEKNLLVLHRRAPEAANGVLRLITYFMKHGGGVGPMHRDIRAMIMKDPETAEELLDFIRKRGIQSFHYLDPEAFKESRDIAAKPLRDGFL